MAEKKTSFPTNFFVWWGRLVFCCLWSFAAFVCCPAQPNPFRGFSPGVLSVSVDPRGSSLPSTLRFRRLAIGWTVTLAPGFVWITISSERSNCLTLIPLPTLIAFCAPARRYNYVIALAVLPGLRPVKRPIRCNRNHSAICRSMTGNACHGHRAILGLLCLRSRVLGKAQRDEDEDHRHDFVVDLK